MNLDELKIACIRSLKEEAVAKEKSMLAHRHREAFFGSATQSELAQWESFLDGLSAWVDSANPSTAKEAIADLDAAFPWAANDTKELRDAIARLKKMKTRAFRLAHMHECGDEAGTHTLDLAALEVCIEALEFEP